VNEPFCSEPEFISARYPWGPCCSLFPAVRGLIVTAHTATCGAFPDDYAVNWLPDLPLLKVPPKFVPHDCRRVPADMLGGDKTPRTTSAGTMRVTASRFVFSFSPRAVHYALIAVCDNCKAAFFTSAWDRDDTLEKYVSTLKRKKK